MYIAYFEELFLFIFILGIQSHICPVYFRDTMYKTKFCMDKNSMLSFCGYIDFATAKSNNGIWELCLKHVDKVELSIKNEKCCIFSFIFRSTVTPK